MSELYTDGGVIGINPSGIGGTYAYCLIEDDKIILSDAGVIIPNSGNRITNNHSEFTAALMGLEALPDGWSGNLCSDSQVTLGRLRSDWKLNNVPCEWVTRARNALARLGKVIPVLIQGHPTKQELNRGMGNRGYPVSKWNVYCDHECNRVAKEYMKVHEVKQCH